MMVFFYLYHIVGVLNSNDLVVRKMSITLDLLDL